MKIVTYFVVLAICCFGAYTAAPAQMAGNTYATPAGGTVGGGGSSAGNAFGVVGAVPLQPAGLSGGNTFMVHGGLTAAIASGVAALYAGPAVDTVPSASRLLKVAYIGGTGPATGTFHYRFGGQTAFTSAAMGAGAGDTLVYTVAPSLLDAHGLEYYFEVKRGTATGYAGSPLAPYQFVVEFTPAVQAGPPYQLPDASYRMVSVPLDITGSNTVKAIFEDNLGTYDPKQWRLFRYDNATKTNVEFPNAAPVKAGRAYWLIARGGDKVFAAPGFTRVPNRNEGGIDYFEVPLDSGWNQLANPLPFPVAWADIIYDTTGGVSGPDPSFVEDTAYYFTGGGYVGTTTVPAWEGVFLNVRQPGVSALFRYRDANAAPVRRQEPTSRPVASTSSWEIELTLQAKDQFDAGNFLGVRADASVGLDRYDYSEPPPSPNGVELAFKLPDGTPGLKRSDYRPVFSDGATWELVLPQATDRMFTARGLDKLPAGMTARLILDAGLVIKLVDGQPVNIANDVQSAQLVVGNAKYIAGSESGVLPDAFALHQNFPNPFNPDTRIRFALPQETKVRVDVFNVLGQKVRTLADGSYPAGTYDLVWDGRNDQGRGVGSGVYFYRLSSDAFTQTRRMVLMK